MRCPFCAHENSQVKDSRPSEDGAAIRRRRQCEACGARFTTFERVQLRDLTVVKKTGERETFDREKLARSIAVASIWVATEYLWGTILTGMPWGFLGHSQSRFLAMCQIADITGVYGISFWVVLIFCAASIVLALIVGRDPAIRAYKQARERGEEITPEPVPAMSE